MKGKLHSNTNTEVNDISIGAIDFVAFATWLIEPKLRREHLEFVQNLTASSEMNLAPRRIAN